MTVVNRRGDPEVFSRNLRRLTVLWDLSQKSAAQQISRTRSVKIGYSWYRMLCSKGLAQANKRSLKKLSAIADFFTLLSVDNLWDEKLVRFELAHDLVVPTHESYSLCLISLLETGKHDYLKGLLTRLYELEYNVAKAGRQAITTPKDDDHFENKTINDRPDPSIHRRGRSVDEIEE